MRTARPALMTMAPKLYKQLMGWYDEEDMLAHLEALGGIRWKPVGVAWPPMYMPKGEPDASG